MADDSEAHYLLHDLLSEAKLSDRENLQLLLFNRHFDERVMGLLAALIPDLSKVHDCCLL